MPNIDADQGLMPSLLDRLIDPDSGGTVARRGYGIEQMIDAVRRDLEDLLNTRQSHQGMPEEYGELHNSIAAYGLPDLTSLEAITSLQRAAIGRVIEKLVERFEPRLRHIRATMMPAANESDRTVRFRVDARLNVDPAPEVAFDTVLELSTGHYNVNPAG